MHPFAKKIVGLFRGRKQKNTRRNPFRRQLFVETLESRLAPASFGLPTTAPGLLTGLVYLDSNANNVHDAGEMVLPGVTVELVGTTNQGQPVDVSTSTNANGQYTFFQVQPGTYSLIRGSTNVFVGNRTSFGNLGGTMGTDTVSGISVAQGQVGLNYDFGVRGFAPQQISLRDFLSSFNGNAPLPSPGPGVMAADFTVDPSTPATAGTASLSGSVENDANLSALAGVEIALSGIDNTGRDIFKTTTTNSSGTYQFSGLNAGNYTLNVIRDPAGFRSDLPHAGSLGGLILRNGQITHILVGPGDSGTNYNFGELPLAAAGSGPLVISAALADDTAGPGGTTSDGLTSDPTIMGRMAGSFPITSVTAGFDGAAPAQFTSLLDNFNSGNTFYLNAARLNEIAGGTLTNGLHRLHLRATDSAGHLATLDVVFTLLARPPAAPTLHLDASVDPNQTGRTTASVVTLLGHTSANVQVELVQNGVSTTTTSDASGNYSFGNVTLAPGADSFTVRATDAAGNVSELNTFLVHEIPLGSPSNALPENVQHGATNIVDLSGIFVDPNLANSQVRLNTTAGVINLQLFDAQAPQTVANFFNYVATGRYTNDIFHRLVAGFVLQGGGFTFHADPGRITTVPTDPSIQNEFNTNLPDSPGTIAMAKLPGNANSATSQFFFNLGDNSQSLGASNDGGFTVFGKVMSGADQRIINTLAAFPVVNESATNSAFNTLPLRNFSGSFPASATAANLAMITSASIVRRTDTLTYTILSNSNTSVVDATISAQHRLRLRGLAAGTATITVQATDSFGSTATATFTVTVS
jgi:cyclophilin family peptidyl-prolyl cis-trans isomerase